MFYHVQKINKDILDWIEVNYSTIIGLLLDFVRSHRLSNDVFVLNTLKSCPRKTSFSVRGPGAAMVYIALAHFSYGNAL